MMKRWTVWLVIFAVAVGLTACSKRKEEPKAPAPATAPAPAVAPAPTVAPAAGSTAQTPTLAGTTWLYDGITVVFRDETALLLKGGMITELAPNGLEGTYTLENGVMKAQVMDQTVSGTFDGASLVVDGKPAVRQQ